MASVVTDAMVDLAIDAAMENSVTAEEVMQRDRAAYHDMLEAVFTALHFELQKRLSQMNVLHS